MSINNTDWLKENWFKVGILIIGIGLSLILFSTEGNNIKNETEVVSPVEYKNLNEECQKYGEEKYGGFYNYDNYMKVYREYKYSIPLKTCVMRLEKNFEDRPEMKAYYTVGLEDIYLDKKIIFASSQCENSKGCSTLSDLMKKESEIWGDTKY
jgi:hypothetical protein